jgi:hypothetical protein
VIRCPPPQPLDLETFETRSQQKPWTGLLCQQHEHQPQLASIECTPGLCRHAWILANINWLAVRLPMPGLSHPIPHQPVQGTRGRREDRSEAKDPSSRPRSHGQDVPSSPSFPYSLRTHESSAAIVQSAVQRPCFQQGAVTYVHLAGYGGVLKLKRRGSRNTASARPRLWSGRKVLEKTLVRQRPLSSIVESDLKRRGNRAEDL